MTVGRKQLYSGFFETQLDSLLRSLDAFERDMNAADRSMIGKTKESVQEVHDRLLQDIMTGKKK